MHSESVVKDVNIEGEFGSAWRYTGVITTNTFSSTVAAVGFECNGYM